MADPYLGEIRMFGGNFAPRGWSECNGQLLPKSQNERLFMLFGCNYGGDCRTTMALPDLRSRIPIGIGYGSGSGLPWTRLGQMTGVEQVKLAPYHIGEHSHDIQVSENGDGLSEPKEQVLGQSTGGANLYGYGNEVCMHQSSIDYTAGQGLPHDNRMPYLSINFIICLEGEYPKRN